MQVLELLPPRNVNIHGDYRILKVDGRQLIGGYASVEVRDSQGEIITVGALKEALEKFLTAKDYRNVHVMHSNVEVGKLLAEAVTDSDGKSWQTHVDQVGLFVVCEINRPISATDRVWNAILEGELSSFSIGGEAIHRSGPDGDIIDKLELHEITICVNGANAPAKFVVIKSQPIPDVDAADSIIVKQKGRSFMLVSSHTPLVGKTGSMYADTKLEQCEDMTESKKEKKKMTNEPIKTEPEVKADAPVNAVAPEVLELKALVEKLLAEIEEMKSANTKKADPAPIAAPAPVIAAPVAPAYNKSEFMKDFVSELVKMYPGEKRTAVPTVGSPGQADFSQFNVTDEQLVKESWRETEARLRAARRAGMGGIIQ